MKRIRGGYAHCQQRLNLTCYRRSTHQKALTQHPHHVDVSESLFTDLTMVGVIYKLDTMFLKLALFTQNTQSFWVPFAIYLSLYDAWEVRPRIDAQFKTKGKSMFQHAIHLILWMLIALMGTTLQVDTPTGDTSNEEICNSSIPFSDIPSYKSVTWARPDAILFAAFKASHAFLRLLTYIDIVCYGISTKARNAALPRLIMYGFGLIPLIIAPILMSSGVNLDTCVGMFALSFFLQKSLGFILALKDPWGIWTRASEVKPNWPFFIHRLREWNEIQLGACILGLLSFPLFDYGEIDQIVELQIGVMASGYLLIALLDFFSYTTHPPDFRTHALARGGILGMFWAEGFVVVGLGLLGLQVALRYGVLSPLFDICTKTENLHILWLLSISTIVAVMASLVQQLTHTQGAKKRRFWIIKFLLACTMVIAPSVTMASPEALKNIAIAFYVILNSALAVTAILIVHALSGGFQRKVAKKRKMNFIAYSLATVIALAWLARARRNIALRAEQQALLASTEGASLPAPTKRKLSRLRTRKPHDHDEVDEDEAYDGLDAPEMEEEIESDEDDRDDASQEVQEESPLERIKDRLQSSRNLMVGERPPRPSSLSRRLNSFRTLSVNIRKSQSEPFNGSNGSSPAPSMITKKSDMFDGDAVTTEIQKVNLDPVDEVSSEAEGSFRNGEDEGHEMNGQSVHVGTYKVAEINGGPLQPLTSHSSESVGANGRIAHRTITLAIGKHSDHGKKPLAVSTGTGSRWTHGGSSAAGEGPSAMTQVFKKTLNKRIYEFPTLLNNDDIFAEFKISWSDLFLDIIYVGAVFRIGDYLTAAIGLGDLEIETVSVPNGIYLYGCLFLAVFSCWFAKLRFTSKCGVSDVVHKFVDVLQGFFIFVMAAWITSPQSMVDDLTSTLVFTVALIAYHITMVLLWVELGITANDGTTQRWVAKVNFIRSLSSVFAAVLALISLLVGGPWELTSFFYAATWLFPLLEQLGRIVLKIETPFDEAKLELLAYVQHRTGDLLLLWLGEGVIQIQRSQSSSRTSSDYAITVFAFAFFNLSMCRTLIFKLGCFSHESLHKHSAAAIGDWTPREKLYRDYGLWLSNLLRGLSGPAIVAMGIGLKKIVYYTNYYNQSSWAMCEVKINKKGVYVLFCAAAVVTHFIIVAIYHIHQTVYFRGAFKWKQFLVGLFITGLFMVFPYIPCMQTLTLLLCTNVVWIISVFYHAYSDDFLRVEVEEHVSDHSVQKRRHLERAGSSFMEVKRSTGDTEEFMAPARALMRQLFATHSSGEGPVSSPTAPAFLSKPMSREKILAEFGTLNELRHRSTTISPLQQPVLASSLEGNQVKNDITLV